MERDTRGIKIGRKLIFGIELETKEHFNARIKRIDDMDQSKFGKDKISPVHLRRECALILFGIFRVPVPLPRTRYL